MCEISIDVIFIVILFLSRSTMAVTSRLPRGLLLGLALGISVSLASTAVALYARTRWKRRIARREPWTPIQLGRLSDEVVDGVPGLVGL